MLSRWIDSCLSDVALETFAKRAGARFFVGLLTLSLPLLTGLLFFNAVIFVPTAMWTELGLLAAVVSALSMVRRNELPKALEIYAWVLPLGFSFYAFATGADSDQYLAWCLLNLALQAVVNSSARPLLIALGVAITGEITFVLGVWLPASLPARMEEVLGQLVRFTVVMGVGTALLLRLLKTYRTAAYLYDRSHHELESLVDERTRALTESQERLERAGASLAEGEKLASLGRIVAGIAHEMNTPLGALQASAEHLGARSVDLLADWTGLVPRAGTESTALVLQLVREVELDVARLDSRRIREYRKVFALELAGHGLPNAEATARMLADFGLKTLSDDWLILLRHPESEWLLARLTEAVEWTRSASIVTAASKRVADQVLGLRRYSVNPKPGRPLTPVDLGQNIETVLLVYRSQFPKTVKIHRSFPKLGPWVLGDSDRLMQVWSNLLMNAVQALKGVGKITLDARAGAKWATVHVTDNGPGIPWELQERVLEPFFSTKPNGEGMGLGLKIVQTIVAEHGGTLTFESQPGRTAFRVRLPVTGAPND